MFSSKIELLNAIKAQPACKPFITDKHHPERYETAAHKGKFRTIFNDGSFEKIEKIFESDSYKIMGVSDGGIDSYIIEPVSPSIAPPLGWASGSIHHPTAIYDRIRIVSGSYSGFHGHPECQDQIVWLMSGSLSITGYLT